MKTQVVQGVHLPEYDTHFGCHLEKGPVINGKGTYQLLKFEKALTLCRRRAHAVDVGAHVGLWSMQMVRHFRWVTAFEPLPIHAHCFRQNLRSDFNIELFAHGLADKPGVLKFDVGGENSGNAHVGQSAGEEVKVETLDAMEVDTIDFLKIDVEGFELQVIHGGEKTIRRDRPVMVVEQKKGNAERYGVRQTAAVETLVRWGAKVAWERSGDFCLIWE